MSLKQRYKWIPMLMGCVMFVLGIVLFLGPQTITDRIPFILGFLLIFIGGSDLIYSFLTKDYKIGTNMQLIQGTINVMIGIIFLVKPELTIDYLGICFGLCALVMGAIKLNLALDHYQLGNSNPSWYALDGIIRIVFAIFLIFNPIGGINVWIMLVGAYFIISSIDIFIASIMVEKLFKN